MSISYIDFDRVTDTLMYLSDSVVLEFTVQLSNKDRNGNRGFLHSESVQTGKFNDQDEGRIIYRKMTSFYFVLKDKTAFDRSIILRPQDIQSLKISLDLQVIPWFIGSKSIYRTIDNELKIIGQYNRFEFAKNEYTYLIIEPIVYTYSDDTFKEGVRLYISSSSVYTDIDLDKFMGLYYFISNTDMYSAATNLVLYAKCPPYSINTWQRNVGLAGAINASVNDSTWNNSNGVRKSNGFLDNIKKKEKKE